MEYLKDYVGSGENKDFLIVGGGRTIKDYEDKIIDFIKSNSIVTIGINKLLPSIPINYQLWTNKQRYITLKDGVIKESKLMFGCNLDKRIIKKNYEGEDYICVNYTSQFSEAMKEEIDYKDGKIFGFFRTAGTLAIMIAHIFGANNIYIVGMDGYTLYGKEDLLSKNKHHHCYGEGYTDDANWEKCKKKDDQVDENLKELHSYGVNFKIITPTKFKDVYDFNILG